LGLRLDRKLEFQNRTFISDDIIDEIIMETLRLTEEEYLFLNKNASDEDLELLTKIVPTFSQRRKILKYLQEFVYNKT
jgi:hypothetical protein